MHATHVDTGAALAGLLLLLLFAVICAFAFLWIPPVLD